jgi:putative ABC transport system ATP-binding protein
MANTYSNTRIRIHGLKRTFKRGNEVVHALAGIDLSVPSGGFMAVMGPSGCGKTTLLNILAGLDRPDIGEVWIDDKRIDQMNETQLAITRCKKIGIIFQSFHLLANMSTLENIMLPALLIGTSSRVVRNQAMEIIDHLNLNSLVNRFPDELSGGQQQRVAIARALINQPSILLADEPTGNLDQQNGQEIIRMLLQLHKQGQTIILVTHDPQLAAQAERILVMQDGRAIDLMTGHKSQRPPLAHMGPITLE